MQTTHQHHPNQPQPVLYMAMELSKTKWVLTFATGRAQPPRKRTIEARDLQQLQQEIRAAKRALRLDESCRCGKRA